MKRRTFLQILAAIPFGIGAALVRAGPAHNFKQAWYHQVLRRYNEAIALDYEMPFQVVEQSSSFCPTCGGCAWAWCFVRSQWVISPCCRPGLCGEGGCPCAGCVKAKPCRIETLRCS
jgi:hypothetical protein